MARTSPSAEPGGARLYHPEPLTAGATVALSEGACRHVQARRLERGDPVTLFCGDGREFVAELAEVGRRGVFARVLEVRAVDRESPLEIVLVQGICAGDRMDWVIQKATELGVSAVQPLLTVRSVVRLRSERRERREQHWQNVAIAACEQCGRNRVPQVRNALDLGSFLALPAGAAARLLLSPRAAARVADQPRARQVELAVGPEGGFAPEEAALLEAHRFVPVRLGPRTLRTETAPLAAIAVLQSCWGDL
jgi:16S rRNA (uracil1498-N3)-methyltransferase